jgi:hydrogenase-4 membrane subunit HyfE
MLIDSEEIVALIGVGILLTALYLQSESFVAPLIRGVALQSLLLAVLLGWLAWTNQSVDLAILAVLAIAIRVVLIPYILRRQIRAFRWRLREVQAAHRVTGHALTAVALAVIAWFVFEQTLASAFPSPGGALPFVLLVQGLLMLATRSNTIVQVIGYLEEENAIVYAGALFAQGFPLFVEVVIFLDVLGVVLVGVVLSIQRDVTGTPEQAGLEELSG